MERTNRQWLLARRPRGMVRTDDFAYREAPAPVPDLSAGEILVRAVMVSFEPAMRGWMDDVPSYLPPVELDAPMRAPTIARIVESGDPAYPVGRLVSGMFGWQDYAIANRPGTRPVTLLPEGALPRTMMGAMGGSTLTAHIGLFAVGGLKPGETVLVSGAAGAVGSAAAQMARIKGCRVIGIAGGAEKCAWLKTECGIDAVIDYKAEPVGPRLGELAPDGIDLFFDNVGGDILEAAIDHMVDHGRIVLCGGISTYNDAEPSPGPRNMMKLVTKRLHMRGFILFDHADVIPEAQREIAGWVADGAMTFREDVQHGFDHIPRTFLRLFSGENRGKQLLELDKP